MSGHDPVEQFVRASAEHDAATGEDRELRRQALDALWQLLSDDERMQVGQRMARRRTRTGPTLSRTAPALPIE